MDASEKLPMLMLLPLFIPAINALPVKKPIHNFGPSVQSEYKMFSPSGQETFISDAPSAAVKVMTDMGFKDIVVSRAYQTDAHGTHHVYLQQSLNGLLIANAVANVNLDPYGRVLSVGHSFYSPNRVVFGSQDATDDAITPSEPLLKPLEGFKALLDFLSIELHQEPDVMEEDGQFTITYKEELVPVKLAYLTNSEKTRLILVWDIVLDLDYSWYNAFVDAQTGEVQSLIDWVSHATFNVFPVGVNDPEGGKRKLLKNPEHPLASRIGWNARIERSTIVRYNVTKGNNVYAQNNPDGGDRYENNYRPRADPNLNFDFPLNLKEEPETYVDAAITNLFYWNNIMHDLFYLYGFNEVAGNFQDYNFNKGGKGNDAVIANAQDGSGTNNANFATPPDGHHGRMRMYVWTATTPKRDGDLESGIIIHEYAHGISTRLTGGPDNSNCLGWGESGGMGEGWGDFFATILRMDRNTTKNDDFGMGEYSAGRGIRRYKYSTSLETNPSTYGFVRKPGYWEVHAKGEVWAEILYDVYFAIVEKHGFDPSWFDVPIVKYDIAGKKPKAPKAPKAGNKLMLRLVVDGLKLQPCYPTFVDARDAIILADQINTKGENKCELWTAFAKRGLGVNARSGGHEDFVVPQECQ